MTETIWQNIAATPWWVFALGLYLIRLSYQATKPRRVALNNFYLLPGLFITASCMCMLAMPTHMNFNVLAIWLCTSLAGAVFGYVQFALLKIKSIKAQHAIYLPGSFIPAIILALLVGSKYYYGYSLHINLIASLLQPENLTYLLAFYGTVTGLALGRLSYVLRCLRTGPYVLQDNTP